MHALGLMLVVTQEQGRAATLRRLLEAAIVRQPADGILLSAGLDTSAIAALACAAGLRPMSVTVCWDDTAPDLDYARELAARLGLTHHVVWANAEVLLASMPAVIGVLGSFDPMELRNSAVQYLGLQALAERGCGSAYVGDAADELFAGYSYMTSMTVEALDAYTRELASFMRFSAEPLGQALGVHVESPYLDPAIVEFAVELDPQAKVGVRDGERHGKWVLRRAVEDLLPERFVWRTKTPAEMGSGSTRLADVALARLDESEFTALRADAERDGVRLRDREQAFYYRMYRQEFGPPSDQLGAVRCPDCRGALRDARSRYCGVCGAYPVDVAP